MVFPEKVQADFSFHEIDQLWNVPISHTIQVQHFSYITLLPDKSFTTQIFINASLLPVPIFDLRPSLLLFRNMSISKRVQHLCNSHSIQYEFVSQIL